MAVKEKEPILWTCRLTFEGHETWDAPELATAIIDFLEDNSLMATAKCVRLEVDTHIVVAGTPADSCKLSVFCKYTANSDALLGILPFVFVAIFNCLDGKPKFFIFTGCRLCLSPDRSN